MPLQRNLILVFPQTKPLYEGGQDISLQVLCGQTLWQRMCTCAQKTHMPWEGIYPTSEAWDHLAQKNPSYRADTVAGGLLATQSIWENSEGSLLLVKADMPFFLPETVANMVMLRNETTEAAHTFICGKTPILTAIDIEKLKKYKDKLKNTDTIESLLAMLKAQGDMVEERQFVRLPEAKRIITLADWSDAQRELYVQNNYDLLQKGVQISDVYHTYIDTGVTVGAGTYIYPDNHLEGQTVIGKNCILYPGNHIINSTLGDGVKIRSALIQDTQVKNNVLIGPFVNLRPGTVLEDGVRIGDFVEIKNSHVGKETRISHLTYVGDATVGEDCNIGCSVVFSNYDGIKKYHTQVGDKAFVGCNANLIAPVTIGDGAYIAAGTTITQDVPPEALAIGRNRQENKELWAKKFREMRQGK